MEIVVGSLVRSKAGRDKGDLFIVLKKDSEYVYLADGKSRKAENPKKKKIKHVQPSGKISDEVLAKLAYAGSVENFEVRNALAELGGYNIG